VRRAIFLDRDSTIIANQDGHAVNTVEDIKLLPGVAEGLSSLKKLGFLLVVVTNQGGVPLGYVTLETLKSQHERIDDLLMMAGAPRIDGYYYCTHFPSAGCKCRKPMPGMLLDAARDLGIDLGRSYMVGDNRTDVVAGKAAGVKKTLQVFSDLYDGSTEADLFFHRFDEAAEAIATLEDTR
jgi:D-glycero-D-manno-heptose 1,7-bisphosphate phosphatase